MTNRLAAVREKLATTEEMELSIGTVIVRSHVSLMDLAAAGHIPATLLIDMEELGEKAKINPRKAGAEGMSNLVMAINAVAVAAFIDPPVAHVADEEHLGVSEIPFADRMTVFYRFNQGAEPLVNFRPQQQGRVNGVAPAGDELPLAAVGDTGD